MAQSRMYFCNLRGWRPIELNPLGCVQFLTSSGVCPVSDLVVSRRLVAYYRQMIDDIARQLLQARRKQPPDQVRIGELEARLDQLLASDASHLAPGWRIWDYHGDLLVVRRWTGRAFKQVFIDPPPPPNNLAF